MNLYKKKASLKKYASLRVEYFISTLRIKDLECYLCSNLSPFILTFDRLAVASLTREITVRTAAPMPSMVKLENRFIQRVKLGSPTTKATTSSIISQRSWLLRRLNNESIE